MVDLKPVTLASLSPGLWAEQPWWMASVMGQQPHTWLESHITGIVSRQTLRSDNTRKLMRIFEFGYRAGIESMYLEPSLRDDHNFYNPAKNAIETVHAKVCKARILPMVLSSGATPDAQHKAKKATKALEAEFEANNVDAIKEDIVLDAFVTMHGAGVAKVFADHIERRVVIEHVPIEDIYIDDVEGRRRAPRSLYQKHQIDRYVALDLFGRDDDALYGAPDYRRERILRAPHYTDPGQAAPPEANIIELWEAWHLPSGPGTDDGRHTIIVKGGDCTLRDEQWCGPDFPFAFYVPRKRRRSFWGMSMMYELAPAQLEYERITSRMQKGVSKMGGTHVVAPRSANVHPGEIDNDQGTFIEYDGPVPPSTWNPDLFNPQLFQYHQSIPQLMFANKGISMLAAQSQLPAGLSQASGKALQVFEDFESERMIPEHRELERLHIRISHLVFGAWKELLMHSDAKVEVYFRTKMGSIETIDLRDVVDIDRSPIISVFPVSQLAKTPAAKFAQLVELMNAGAITVEQFRRLYELPDLEAEAMIDTADDTLVDWVVDEAILRGVYHTPDGFVDWDRAIERARRYVQLYRQQEVPNERLDLIRQWIEAAQYLKAEATAAAQAASMPPPSAPANNAQPSPQILESQPLPLQGIQ